MCGTLLNEVAIIISRSLPIAKVSMSIGPQLTIRHLQPSPVVDLHLKKNKKQKQIER